MELILNLAWLVLSTVLVLGYAAFARSALRSRRWTVVVALVVLILVLLPAISMTDDIAAINNPAETDHMFRRHEAPLPVHTDVAGVAIVPLLLAIFAISIARAPGERFEVRSLTAVLRDGAMRALGVRPPPFLILAAS
jgi:hypothetical protein